MCGGVGATRPSPDNTLDIVTISVQRKEATVGQSGEMIRGVYEAFGRGDVPTVLGAMDDQISWNEAENAGWSDGNPYIGPNAILERIFMRKGTEIDAFNVTPVNIIDGGDTVAVEGRYTGTVKATGKPLDAQFVHVWGIKNGKIVRHQQYTDSKQWSKAFAS